MTSTALTVAEPQAGAEPVETVEGEVMAFAFGDPEGALDKRELLGYVEAFSNGRWYEPPVSMDGLTRAFDLPGPHSSCIRLKVNLLASHFMPTRYLSAGAFRRFALDFIATGNGYLDRADNMLGRPLAMNHILARYARRGVDPGRYFFVPGWRQEHEFKQNAVFHLFLEHPSQEIYGLPEFLGSLQSALLGEAATIFRRRYYLNGSHAGFIFYSGSDKMSDGDAAAIREQLRRSKGPGNFRNLFLHMPGGGKDGVQVIPVGEVVAKDEFAGIKNISRDDVLSAHRTPPQLVGIVPMNNAGFGDVTKAAAAFHQLEILPLMGRFLELNEWLGAEAVRFKPYEPVAAGLPAA